MAGPQIEWIESSTEGMATTSAKGEYGICSICGEKAYHHRARKCEDHKDTETAKPKRQRPTAASNANRSGNGPNATSWTKTISKLLLIVTSFVAVGIVSRAQILDSNDELIDDLSLTEGEALDIARPMARFMSRTSISRKYGSVIVENDDLIDAGIAVSDYLSRVRQASARIEQIINNREQAFKQHANPQSAPNHFIGGMNDGPTGPATESGHADGGGDEYAGPPRGQYAAPIYSE